MLCFSSSKPFLRSLVAADQADGVALIVQLEFFSPVAKVRLNIVQRFFLAGCFEGVRSRTRTAPIAERDLAILEFDKGAAFVIVLAPMTFER